MIDTKIRPGVAPEKKLQPPARWRNWWRARSLARIHCRDCLAAAIIKPGDIIMPPCEHFNTYPAKEIAEIAAAKALTGRWAEVAEYAGATKVGERP